MLGFKAIKAEEEKKMYGQIFGGLYVRVAVGTGVGLASVDDAPRVFVRIRVTVQTCVWNAHVFGGPPFHGIS